MKRRDELLVGLLLLVAVALALGGTIWIARGGLKRGYPMYSQFPWGAGLKPGQQVLLATSYDFAAWSEPVPLIEPRPGKKGTPLILTTAGFHPHAGRLVAYAGQYAEDRSDTRLLAGSTPVGEHLDPVQDLGIAIIPNHGPQKIANGRLILSGNITFPYTDDPGGLSGWQVAGLHPPDLGDISDNPFSFWKIAQIYGWPAALCEGSFFQTGDGVIHMLLRATGEGQRGRLWVTESRDGGEIWSSAIETEFRNDDAKFHCGRLPDGCFYYIGNPVPGGRRNPLVLSLSQDGETFDRHFVIADEPYEMKRPGRWKGGEYGYPHTLVHDGAMHVIVSRQKEAVEVFRFPLNEL